MTLLYQIQAVPGKGQGLVAQQDIRTGTRILSEAPLLTTEGILSASQTEGWSPKGSSLVYCTRLRRGIIIRSAHHVRSAFIGQIPR